MFCFDVSNIAIGLPVNMLSFKVKLDTMYNTFQNAHIPALYQALHPPHT
jgi:hypothetical protein